MPILFVMSARPLNLTLWTIYANGQELNLLTILRSMFRERSLKCFLEPSVFFRKVPIA